MTDFWRKRSGIGGTGAQGYITTDEKELDWIEKGKNNAIGPLGLR